MTYVKLLLGGLSALFLSGFVLMFITVFREASQSKATGLAVFVVWLIESVRSPLFWLLAVLFSAMFFATGRLSSAVFRVVLFWLPAIGISMFGLGLLGCFAMLMPRISHPPGQCIMKERPASEGRALSPVFINNHFTRQGQPLRSRP